MIQYMSSVRLEINDPKIRPVIGSEAKNPLPVRIKNISWEDIRGLNWITEDYSY